MNQAYMFRLWDEGQRHLASGRYSAARRALERAETLAWRQGDAGSLARIYLPLLEVRRLMRYQAAEGRIVICESHTWGLRGLKMVREFVRQAAGTILLASGESGCRAATVVRQAANRTGSPLEALVLVQDGTQTRLASPANPRFGSGVPMERTRDARAAIGQSTDANLIVPLPVAGIYDGKAGLGALARESLLIAWEALALRWQGRHPLASRATPWDEMSWLRQALHVDPACEPVTMRLIALAEGVARAGNV